MGRRSRKREGPGGASATRDAPTPRAEAQRTGARQRGSNRRPSIEERPKPPWHPFPLVELCTLLGLVLIVVGFVTADSPRGRVMLVCGLGLASLAGLDTALREHFTGYRSHSVLLSALPAVLGCGAVFFARGPALLGLAVLVAVFSLAFVSLRGTFQRKAGVSWRA